MKNFCRFFFSSALITLIFFSLTCGPRLDVPVVADGCLFTNFRFLDGNALSTGLNHLTTNSAWAANLGANHGKLYAVWIEAAPTRQLRASVFNGSVDNPQWSSVDGNGTTGINFSSLRNAWNPQATSFNSKLYVNWGENNPAGFAQVRMAVYNGYDASPGWAFVDGNAASGLNYLSTQAADFTQSIVFRGKIYLSWPEYSPTGQIRVKVYNGNDAAPAWSFVDGGAATGLNRVSANTVDNTVRMASVNNKLYITWTENNGSFSQVRAVVYGGNDAAPAWYFIDGNAATVGLNRSSTANAAASYLQVFEEKLYLTWGEGGQIRVSVYNGNDSAPVWKAVEGKATGLNYNSVATASEPALFSYGGRLYVGWNESGKSRLAVYNGDDVNPSWSFADGGGAGGLNRDASAVNAYYLSGVTFQSKLFLSWLEGAPRNLRVGSNICP